MRHWIIGALGVWIALAAFILLPGTTQKLVLLISGAAVAVLAFWPARHDQHGV